jgi:N-acetylneuraminic acid mutarotase
MIVSGVLLLSAKTYARDLTFEERVRAQEAIERVYHSHQAGATRPFDHAVPRALLEKKVRTYLGQTAALQEIWGTRITGAMLRRELERMAAGTRMPERLRELYAALGNDAVLIQECLARPALVDRLSRHFFANDATIHAGPRQVAESLRRDLVDGRLDPRAGHVGRTVTELVRLARGETPRPEDPERPSAAGAGVFRLELDSEEFDRDRSRLPDRAGEVGPIVGHGDTFVMDVVLDSTTGSVRFATYSIPRIGWDSWWDRTARRLDHRKVGAVAEEGAPLPTPSTYRENSLSGAGCVPDDTWDNGSFDDWPEARANHTAVWTGSLMLVWGGPNPGGRYDPATDAWSTTSLVNAPQTRSVHTAVWTGSEMIVWGGWNGSTIFGSGGRYDPAADTWRATSGLDAPSARFQHAAVWTGSEMIVWGGQQIGGTRTDTGGRYDPGTDTWRATSPVDAPSPRMARSVWTGSRMIVWGGVDGSVFMNTGASYNPATDIWTPISETDAPSVRFGNSAVWTGSEMIVWGGYTDASYLDTGGRYNPVTNKWVATSTTDAPAPRSQHVTIWTGTGMIVWGGARETGPPHLEGARYDPATDHWTPVSTTNSPSARTDASAIWTGSVMIVWGGVDGNNTLQSSGGRYDPLLDAWTPTADTSAPSPRYQHAAVWTGNQLIVWGGDPNLSTGGRYDPATDTWSATSITNAPVARQFQTSVWTGDVMIVWGGLAGLIGHALNTGGRYDPVADTWSPTSLTDAPSPRVRHSAVWTGSRMIVWGGSNAGVRTGTGGRYDPATDLWASTSMTDSPLPRALHTAVWTGTEMVVWGGQQFSGVWFDTGARYNPATDGWSPTSTSGAPPGRLGHTAVMAGSLMIVWGGVNGSGPLDTGGRFDTSTNIWSATSTTGAPSPRSDFTAVWTGKVMVIWGGAGPAGPYLDTGGRYDPVADAWTATSVAGGAPAARKWHIATWTGSHMAVWGGWVSGWPGRTGGLYALGHAVDDDGDGLTECGGDCNDGNAAVHPGATEICDGFDNDCDGLADNVASPDGIPFLGVGQPGDAGTVEWSAVATATRYDLVRGDLSILLGTQGDFTSATRACVADDLGGTTTISSEAPPAGSAYWYLVRPVNCGGNGTYDADDPGQAGSSDTGINASASSCP